MKISLKYPSKTTLDRFLRKAEQSTFSYSEIGQSRQSKTPGYDNDHNKILIGRGTTTWKNAKSALDNWQQFPKPWTAIYPNTTPLQEGQTVVVLIRLFGIWWFNSSKIVYAFDEETRYGFAYGTLLEHVEKGEECFWIEQEENGDIYYHIRAFSKPRFWLAKVVYPIARIFQRRFVKQSMNFIKTQANATA